MPDRLTTREAIEQRRQAGGTMYSGVPAGDDLFGDDTVMVSPVIAQGAASLSTTGLTIYRELTESDWKELLDSIQKLRRAFQWIIGDWMLYGNDRGWITTYAEMAALTGLKEKTIIEYTYVCRNIPASIRMDELSFGHFQVIAALPDDDKPRWIARALKESLSIKKLTAAIREEYQPAQQESVAALPSPEVEEDKPVDVTDKKYRRRFNRIVTNLSRGTLARIHPEDIPVLRDWLNQVEKLVKS